MPNMRFKVRSLRSLGRAKARLLKNIMRGSMKYLLTKEDLKGDPEYMVAVLQAAAGRDIYPDSEGEYVYVPERVMERILGVGKAYQLKFTEHAPKNRSDPEESPQIYSIACACR